MLTGVLSLLLPFFAPAPLPPLPPLPPPPSTSSTTSQFAFVYIRQLAVHLRNAMTDGGKDAVKSCCNWQFLNCLRLWVAVLAAYPGENELGALVYPMVRVLVTIAALLRFFDHPPRFSNPPLHTNRSRSSSAPSPSSGRHASGSSR